MHITLLKKLARDLDEHLPFFQLARICSIESLDPRHAAAVRLYNSLTKKYVVTRSHTAPQRAIEGFLKSNESCLRVPFLDRNCLPDMGPTYAREFIFKLVCHGAGPDYGSLLTDINPEDGSFGPGASIGAPTEAQFDKYVLSSQTYTHPYLIDFYRRGTCEGLAKDIVSRNLCDMPPQRVTSSKLTTVPKSEETDRAICIEPSLNLFYQQAIRRFLERRLRRIGIDLANQQEKNQRLAKLGSVSGEFATLDLSKASDTISHRLCKWLLPPALLSELEMARCSHTSINGEPVQLNMISSMGNATTFPLETIIFASVVASAYKILGLPLRFFGQSPTAGVFGDDIIVKAAAVPLVKEILIDFGFTINDSKSFTQGRFRESCGGDYSSGVEVKPVYIKDSLNNRSSLFCTVNRLIEWSVKHDLPLYRTIKFLLGTCPTWKDFLVPTYMPIDSGIWTSFSSPKTFRYLSATTRTEIRNISPEHSVLFINGYITQDDKGKNRINRRSYRTHYRQRKSKAVVVSPTTKVVLRAVPENVQPVVNLLTVDSYKWESFLTYYNIPNQ